MDRHEAPLDTRDPPAPMTAAALPTYCAGMTDKATKTTRKEKIMYPIECTELLQAAEAILEEENSLQEG